jgi:outer membrane biosynthesis protein TonB
VTQGTECQNDSSVCRSLRRPRLRVLRSVHVALALPVASLVLLNACIARTAAPSSAPLANSIRTYDPKTGEFSNRAGELTCTKPSVSDFAQSATDYQWAVRESIQALRQRFTACYVAQLRRNAHTSGTSCVQFSVGEAGQVTQVEIATSTLPEALQNCILKSAGRADVPAPSKPPIIVKVPLTFAKR